MPNQSSKTSVCATAAASIAACSIAMVSQHAQAELIWQSGAAGAIGTYGVSPTTDPVFTAGNGNPFDETENQIIQIDFDNDGVADFALFYYASWSIAGAEKVGFGDGFDFISNGGSAFNVSFPGNPTSSAVFDRSVLGPNDTFPAIPIRSNDLNETYSNAQAFLQEPLLFNTYFQDTLLAGGFQNRGFWSGVFTGGDGIQYVGYLDLGVTPDSSTETFVRVGDGSITIYDAGYVQVPEPSSLAFLLASGLMFSRRRRS